MLVNHITWSGGSQRFVGWGPRRAPKSPPLGSAIDVHGGLEGPPSPRRSAARWMYMGASKGPQAPTLGSAPAKPWRSSIYRRVLCGGGHRFRGRARGVVDVAVRVREGDEG